MNAFFNFSELRKSEFPLKELSKSCKVEATSFQLDKPLAKDIAKEKLSKATAMEQDAKRTNDTNEKKRMETQVVVNFKCPEGMDQKEFLRQLKGQERGLNSMSMGDWIRNRDNYKENGRAPEGAEAQRLQREKARQSRIESNQKNGMSYSEAKKEADTWIAGQAALHNPDQIAGGDPNKVSRMGDAKVNSSIGSQWRGRIDSMESAIKEYAKDKPPEELAKTKLNVKLNMEV